MADGPKNKPHDFGLPGEFSNLLKEAFQAQQALKAQQAAVKKPVNPLPAPAPVEPVNVWTASASSQPASPAKPPAAISQEPALGQCRNAFTKAFKLAQSQGKSDYMSRDDGKHAYRQAMPPLIGADNIRDFIACIAQGMLFETISASDGTRLLYAAQIAHSASEKPIPDRGGRPKSTVNKK